MSNSDEFSPIAQIGLLFYFIFGAVFTIGVMIMPVYFMAWLLGFV